MTGILSESEKQDIIKEVINKYPNSSEVQFKMYVEVIAGLRIINKILGDEWYQKAKNEILQETDTSKKHPISNYLRLDQPEKLVRLLNFANFLRNLYNVSNVVEKIQDYVRKEKRTTITTETFNKVFTELKAANYFADKGFRINFIKEERGKKTSDFRVDAKDGSALVECKRKKEQEKLIIESILDSILDANEQLTKSEIPGIIFIDIPFGEVKPEIIKKIEAVKLEDVYPQLKTVHYVLISGEMAVKQYHKTIPNLGRAYVHSYMFPYQNKMSEFRLSPSLESVLLDITISRPKPLLLD